MAWRIALMALLNRYKQIGRELTLAREGAISSAAQVPEVINGTDAYLIGNSKPKGAGNYRVARVRLFEAGATHIAAKAGIARRFMASAGGSCYFKVTII